ncbi:ATP-binding protein [Streptomyces sp. NRRL S-31]|uniref:ATP-binding protein n=1 Tax=Streptomyces sp. NRRL S-31 TaxID=1463898 RepID=UPI0004CBCD63|nr:ATP-binding protein [Streptomyces sp. NRRL S-31]
MPTTETFRIPTRSHHVPTARHHVRKILADWGITDDLADRAILSVNELVTNAVSHCRVGSARVRVTLILCDRELVLEVSDPDRDHLPRPRDPGPDEEGGRGLALVAALADTWGHRRGPYTKTVWACFTLGATEA